MPRIYKAARTNFSGLEEFKEVATKTINEIYGRVKPMDVIDFSFNDTHYVAIGYYDGEEIPGEQRIGEPLSQEAIDAEQKANDSEGANQAAAAAELEAETARIKAIYESKEAVTFQDLVLAAKLGIELPEELALQVSDAVKKGLMSYEAAHAAGLTHIDGVPVLEAAKIAVKAATINAEVAAQNAAAAASEIVDNESAAEAKRAAFGLKDAGEGVLASQAAIDLAEANGVDLKLIQGTGRDGNIKKSDVEDYIANNAPAKENANGNSDEQPNT